MACDGRGRTRARGLRLTLLSRDVELVRAADAAGVEQIGLDLERLGKDARQGHVPDARISRWGFDDLAAVCAATRRATTFTRLDPLHEGSAAQIDRALACGARALMLPFFSAPDDAARFVALVAGRARVALLVETAPAFVRIDRVAALRGVDEIIIGLNDLHQQLGLTSHFELVVSPLFEAAAACVRAAGVRFGFGGVTAPDDAGLPVPPDLVLAQYARLDAEAAWLSRSFVRASRLDDLAARVAAVRARDAWWRAQSAERLEGARRELAAVLAQARRQC